MFRSESTRTWITAILANCLLATQLTVASPPGEWGTATVNESDGDSNVSIALSRSTVAVQFTQMSGSVGYAWECW